MLFSVTFGFLLMWHKSKHNWFLWKPSIQQAVTSYNCIFHRGRNILTFVLCCITPAQANLKVAVCNYCAKQDYRTFECFKSGSPNTSICTVVQLQTHGKLTEAKYFNTENTHSSLFLKGYSIFFFLEIGSFYHSPSVKQLGFTVFESIQLIFWYLEENPIDFHSIYFFLLWKSMRPETVWLLIFF